MKRLIILPVALALALSLLVGPAYGGPSGTRLTNSAKASALSPSRSEAPAPLRWTPTLGLAAAGSGVVQGHVYDYSGAAIAGAVVWIGATDGQGTLVWSHEVTTDALGAYSVSDAPATVNGSIEISNPTTGDTYGGYWDFWFVSSLLFADPGTSTFDLRPGRVFCAGDRGGPWNSWSSPHLEIAGTTASGTPFYTYTQRSGVAVGGPDVVYASALPGGAQLVEFSFWSNQAALWDAADYAGGPLEVTAGATASRDGDPLLFGQSSAYRTYFTNTWWGSGKPGATLGVALKNHPAGMKVQFYGYSDAPNGVTTTWAGKSHTSTGLQEQVVNLKVPTTATPGYGFDIQTYEPVVRYGSYLFSLDVYYQVCTLKASRSSIRRGTPVKLSGVVPVEGHSGSELGTPKYVWIYKRTTSAGVPKVWDARKAGWQLVARVRADGLGRYSSGWQKPTRTTFYVARYAGDDWYRQAYTSVLKLPVR